MEQETKTKVTDPEIESIKAKLEALLIMIVIFLLIFPFHLGSGLNFIIVLYGTAIVAMVLKYKKLAGKNHDGKN